MARLLYIEASPRKKRSASIAVARVFLDAYKQAHPQDEVVEIDLWNKELPAFDGDVIDAKYAIMHGKEHTEAQAKAWERVEEIIAEFKSADKFVFSLPMWNFGIPYRLKHYIDILVQPGRTFSFSPQEGFKGLVTGKNILLIYARGGAYGVDTGDQALDLQSRYMETILGFIGFKNFNSIFIEPTLSGDAAQKEQIMNAAKSMSQNKAKGF